MTQVAGADTCENSLKSANIYLYFMLQVASADVYESTLKSANISLEQGARRSAIWAEVTAAAAAMGGVVPETAGDDLLTEVCVCTFIRAMLLR